MIRCASSWPGHVAMSWACWLRLGLPAEADYRSICPCACTPLRQCRPATAAVATAAPEPSKPASLVNRCSVFALHFSNRACRSIPTIAGDRVYCKMLAHGAVHGAFAGFTGITVGLVNTHYCYLPSECWGGRL